MRLLRSLIAFAALPLMVGGFKSDPLVVEYYPGGIRVTRSISCPIFVNTGAGSPKTFPATILANTTGNDAQWLIYTTRSGGLSVTTNGSTSSGNVTNTGIAGTNFVPQALPGTMSPTIDVDVLFDAGAVNASNSTSIQFLCSSGFVQLDHFFSIN